jgi:hypothetical protein
MLKKLFSVNTLIRVIIAIPLGLVPILFYIHIWPYLDQLISQIPVNVRLIYGLLLFIVILYMAFALIYEQKVLLRQKRSWKIILIQIIMVIIMVLGSGLATSAILALLFS